MKRLVPLFLFAVLSLLFFSFNTSNFHIPKRPKKARNIILLIGDGMGLAQVSTSYYFGDGTSSFSRFRHIGLHQCSSSDHKITDSAAGATAFSTGYKSYNGAIGVNEDSIAKPSILEWAAEQGKSTGLVATSSITHATPAAFYAHVPDRNLQEDIALDFINASVDFAAAGGYTYFCDRKDGLNLLETLTAQGVTVDTSHLDIRVEMGQRYAYFLAPDGLPSIPNGRGDFLPHATQTALDLLSQDRDGFFLMVEGSQIDWAGHDNDPNFLISEVADFERTIERVLDFAEKDGNTLVIVTADHETGGLGLSADKGDYNKVAATFSTGGHTATLIPVFAYGPGARRFMGIYQNNDIFGKMMRSFKK